MATPSLIWLDDFRHLTGVTLTHGGALGTPIWDANSRPPGITFTTFDGVEAVMQVVADGVTATNVLRNFTLPPTALELSIFTRFPTALPASIPEILSIGAAVSATKPCRLKYTSAGTWLAQIENNTSQVVGPAALVGVWQHHDILAMVGGATWSLAYTVDEVLQGRTSRAVAADNIRQVRLGSGTAADNYTAQYKHAVAATINTDYPMGPAMVKYIPPTAEGTDSIGTGLITTQANSTLNMWNVVDEWPADAADYIRQTGIGTTLYAEVLFTGVSDPVIWDVAAYLAYTSGGTPANNFAAILFSAGALATLIGGDISDTDLRYSTKFLARPTGGWSAALVNGLFARVGMSSDATPEPRAVSLLLQYAVPFPDANWLPSYPTRVGDQPPGDAGGRLSMFAFVRLPEAAAVPALSWAPVYPDRPGQAVLPLAPTDRTSLAYVPAISTWGLDQGKIPWLPKYPQWPGRTAPRTAETSYVLVLPPQVTAPVSWRPQYPDRVARAEGSAAGWLAFVQLVTAAVPEMSWSPVYPQPIYLVQAPEARFLAAGFAADAVVGLSWLPSYPQPVRMPRAAESWYAMGAVPDAAFPLSWLPSYPQPSRALRRAEGEALYAFALPQLPVPELSWFPSYPQPVTIQYPARGDPFVLQREIVAVVPELSWLPSYPDRVERARGAAEPTQVAMPVLPPAVTVPPLSWLPIYPDFPGRAAPPRFSVDELTGVAWWPFAPLWAQYESILEYDTTKEGSTIKVYFEAVLEVGAGGGPAFARGFNITDSTVLAGSEVNVSAGTATRVRSAAITMPTGAKEYRAEIGAPLGTTITCRAARLVVDVG